MTATNKRTMIKDLGDNLILRRSTIDDADALEKFNAGLHVENPGDVDPRIGAWVRDLITRPHPTFKPDDFTVVEDTSTGKIVSCLNLISQRWSYEGLADFGVGRVELVATAPEYRKRGLIREQMNVVHQWSAERGELMQAITGIPEYYRQFGYEMAMELDAGRIGYESHVPKLNGDEPYVFRSATENDIPFLISTNDYGKRRSIVRCIRDEAIWRYELNGSSANSIARDDFMIIEDAQTHEPVGYVRHGWDTWDHGLIAQDYEIKPGASWIAISPSVVRYLWKRGSEIHEAKGKRATLWGFWLGTSHPVYDVLRDRLPRDRNTIPYAWYTRIPDLPKFILRIAPAINKQIANSSAVGYTGTLRINRYKSMLTMEFKNGEIVNANEGSREARDWGDVSLPGLTIHQMIFGLHSLDELRAAFPDVYVDTDEGRVLITSIFPKGNSRVIGLA
jgi:hypothetical protein